MTSAQDRVPLALHVPLSSIPFNPTNVPHKGSNGYNNASPAEARKTAVQLLVEDAQARDFDHVCLSLTNSNWQTRWERLCLRAADAPDDPESRRKTEEEAERWRMGGGFMRGEVTVTRLEETEHLIGMASEWLDLDSADEGIRFDSELALRHELAQAAYLNVPVVILPPPRNRALVADYARAVNACLAAGGPYTQISIRISISDPAELINQPGDNARSSGSIMSRNSVRLSTSRPGGPDPSATWELWDVIRTMCGYNPRLSCTLDLTTPLPPSPGALARWASEPTRHILLPASSFISNAKGYPVLSKATQTFLKEVMKQRPTIILSQTTANLHPSGGAPAYPQYVRHLERAARQLHTSPGGMDDFARGYWDWLQAPLQPLMDDLQSSTYEVFERDPVKYKNYEEAVVLALNDRPAGTPLAIYVCGAGRGPLVAGVLRALQRANRQAHVYAIEKNASAFITLQERKALEWGDAVEIILGDMRTLEVPEPADIIVSELLGSFGDNELSPECLDGAMRFLKPDGISIPSSYTAHLAPLSSSKLFNEVNATSREPKQAETPYVVMFQAVNTLSGDAPPDSARCGPRVQECWAFEHPRRDLVLDDSGLPLTNSHNTRSAHLTFHIPHAGALHGLAGYFEAHLYGSIGLSIHPDRQHIISPDMLSWFPLFFPFREPLFLPSNSELDVHVWRLTDSRSRKVWYEWHAEAFLPLTSPTALISSPSLATPGMPSTPGNGVRTPLASPMMDAAQLSGGLFREGTESLTGGTDGSRGTGRIKIGQTSLLNPGGRSSYIGL
ncbi:Protein kinase inhibitor [Phaffia rhodozyma]|uniref:Protein kinase inhibitor n=1 Tax=Phaffia rhodozyma TaxID=264483 RepID=A0A0F7SX06_PHARH|nr:Protein kinase inhibitor [Phaffia rhodozyma]